LTLSVGLADGGEAEVCKPFPHAADDFRVGVVNPQRPIAIAPFRVEDASEKSFPPTRRRSLGPGDDAFDPLHVLACVGPDGAYGPSVLRCLLEEEIAGRDGKIEKVARRPDEGFFIGEGESELVLPVALPSPAVVIVGAEVAVTAHHPAQVTPL